MKATDSILKGTFLKDLEKMILTEEIGLRLSLAEFLDDIWLLLCAYYQNNKPILKKLGQELGLHPDDLNIGNFYYTIKEKLDLLKFEH